MSRDELLALAERVEAATGADREIDRDIALALGFYPYTDDLGCYADPAQACGKGETFAPLDYTASIDAALTLVPSGLILRNYQSSRFVPHSCDVALSWAHGGWIGNSDHSFALALTAAALRAFAQETPE